MMRRNLLKSESPRVLNVMIFMIVILAGKIRMV